MGGLLPRPSWRERRKAKVSVQEWGEEIKRKRKEDVETDLEHDRHHFQTLPRSLSTEHLEKNASEGPDIDLGRIASTLVVDDLGSHPCEKGKKERFKSTLTRLFLIDMIRNTHRRRIPEEEFHRRSCRRRL